MPQIVSLHEINFCECFCTRRLLWLPSLHKDPLIDPLVQSGVLANGHHVKGDVRSTVASRWQQTPPGARLLPQRARGGLSPGESGAHSEWPRALRLWETLLVLFIGIFVSLLRLKPEASTASGAVPPSGLEPAWQPMACDLQGHF